MLYIVIISLTKYTCPLASIHLFLTFMAPAVLLL